MRKFQLAVAVIAAAALMSIPTYAGMRNDRTAGSWELDSTGWWWKSSDGVLLRNVWCWIDGNNDGTAECYYFDNSGYMKSNTQEGQYTINAEGQWTVNGIVQTLDLTGVKPNARNTLETMTLSASRGTPDTWEQTADGHWKYYRSDGTPVVSTWVVIKGTTYQFNADGDMYAWREGTETHIADGVAYGYGATTHPESSPMFADPPTFALFSYSDDDKEMLAMGLDPNSSEDIATYWLAKPFSLYNNQGGKSSFQFYITKYKAETALREEGYSTPYYQGTYSQAGYPVYFGVGSDEKKQIRISKLNFDGSPVTIQQIVDTIIRYYDEHPGNIRAGVDKGVIEDSDFYTFTIYSKK